MELTKDKVQELSKLPTGNVADSVGPQFVMNSLIKPIDTKSKMVGRAVTVNCFPGDNLALHQGMEAAAAGDVLVFDCKGYTEAGHFGDMMATACKVKGIAGVVIDGSCRDSQDILELGLPVFVRAFNPRGTVKESLGSVNVPVVCGGVSVKPGDIIFGDCDGVVVVPQEREDDVFAKALKKYDYEIEVREKLLGDGPIVLMSYNRVNGYAAECERTVFLGEPCERDRKLFDIVMKAREIAYSMVKPGTRCEDIDLATQEYFKSLGYGDAIIHRTGHGIGLGNHEAPWLSAGGDHVLEENMIISIEPALYFNDIGGFRHSDTVLVTKNGYENLTHYPRDLESLIVKDKRTLKKIKGAIIRKAVRLDKAK